MDKLPDLIEPWFFFSLIWSIGASCDNDGRKKFDAWLREKLAAQPDLIKMKLPEEGLCYDFLLDDGGIFNEVDEDEEEDAKIKPIQWKNWMTDLPELILNNDTKFSDIIGKLLTELNSYYSQI